MRSLMVQGTSSGAGKSTIAAALCRIFSDRGMRVAPFKSQNMSRLSYVGDGFEIARAQAVQAAAARAEPSPDMNPILLKPRGGTVSTIYLNGRRLRRMAASEYYSGFSRSAGLRAAAAALARLGASHDLVVMEGAGSPAEVNLPFDVANMGIAERAGSPVLLVSDIERGGSFASLAGTMALLGARHRRLVRGFVLNKFRGDARMLGPGISRLRRLTGRPTLGVVPAMRPRLPAEDSLDGGGARFEWDARGRRSLERRIRGLARTVERSLDMRALEGIVGAR